MSARLLGTLGVAGAVLSVLLIGAQHLADPSIDPVRSTISAYGLGGFTPLFDAGVLALAIGSACVLAGGVRSGLVPVRSAAAAGFATWVAALLLVVAFEKVDWSVGATPSGLVHLYAGLVAFVALPVAVGALARLRWGPGWPVLAAAAAVAALLWLSPFVIGVVSAPWTGVPWWRFVPIGLVQRGLALTEVVAVVIVALWVRTRETAELEGAR